MTKLDLKQEAKHLYQPSAKEPQIVDVPPMNFMMIDGWATQTSRNRSWTRWKR